MDSVVATAGRIAEDVLFPAALATDAAERVPEAHLRLLAEAGLFGIVGPREQGGLDVSARARTDVIERLASGCLATAFVWLQHHTAVTALARSDNVALGDEWLPELCAGRRRAGLALGGSRPGPRQLQAVTAPGGYLLEGSVPWVTGWGLVDVVFTQALSPDGNVVSLFVEGAASETLVAEARRLVAANASCTVALEFRRHFVAGEKVVSIASHEAPPAHDGGGRGNGSLALGVIRRACLLMGPTTFDAELTARRTDLDVASELTMATARAAAVELALRATASLIARSGSRSITVDQHAQRLAREALFLVAFGSRPAIRASLLASLASPEDP